MSKEKLKTQLIDSLCEQIKIDAINGDVTVLEELLGFIPTKNLIQGLPEEVWSKYKNLLTEEEKNKLHL